MGNFFAIVASKPSSLAETDRLFERGLQIAGSFRNSGPRKKISVSSLRIASFARENGSGGVMVDDRGAGDCLLALGSWFHSSGLGPREEQGLLQRYQAVGAVQLARELEGFGLVVIGNVRQNELIVITDVVGSFHAFWRQFPNAIALSGSSLLLAGLGNCTLDPTACQEFVHTGIIYEDRTLFAEVRKLGPASVHWFADGRLKDKQSYWDPSRLHPESLRGNDAVDKLADSVISSVRAITRAFPNPVCDLTGGYDSRAVAAGFLSAGASFATTVSGPTESRDVAVSHSLAALMHVPNLHFPPREGAAFADIQEALFLTDGEYDLVDYAQILRIHRALAAKFQISINGSFGELARGYYWELLVPHTGQRRKLDAAKLASSRYVPRNILSSLFRPDVRIDMVPHFVGMIERNNVGLGDAPNTFQMDATYLGMRMQRWQGRIASSTNRLWPCLSPFIFKSTLEVILQTESSLRKRSLMIRKMLRARQPTLANFPLEHGYPAVPANPANLLRFLPLLNYYRTKVLRKAGLRNHSNSAQVECKAPRLSLWDEPEVRAMLKPECMRSIELFDQDALTTFLSRSRETNFSEDSEWRRLLTIECALNRVQT